jgi:ergothioneine biosynthesis protein EgtB
MRDPDQLLASYQRVRALTGALAERLAPDDRIAQSMPDASPTKWHLGHTTWFFDRMLLAEFVPGHEPDERFDWVFNSYYEAIGPRQSRSERSLATRPTLDEVDAYRASLDEAVPRALQRIPKARLRDALAVLELGIHHEQQHQELLLTDAKHLLGGQRELPAYTTLREPEPAHATAPLEWISFPERLSEIGHADKEAFAFDNEFPRHRRFVEAFELASRPVTQGEYLEFVTHGGYDDPRWWLSDGWHAARSEGWRAPLYWRERGGTWEVFTLRGVEELRPEIPACHLSYFEADAYARFRGARLPTEAEWEVAATSTGQSPTKGNFVEGSRFHPAAWDGAKGLSQGLKQMFGDVWEWTSSAYEPYPRFRPLAGALGEYNGKFMCSQLVLRGGSCLSPRDHLRASYRNFFPPGARWQMTGLRLARWP